MIVLDASVLIAHLDDADLHHGRATEILIGSATEPLGASPLSLAEALVGPAKVGKLTIVRQVIEDLEISTVPLTDDSPVRLAELRASTRLRLADCCVLHAAVSAQAELATFDDRLIAEAAKLGITVHQ